MFRRNILALKHKAGKVKDKNVRILWRSYQKKDAGKRYTGFTSEIEDFGSRTAGGGVDVPLLMERPYPLAELSKRMVRIQIKFESSEDTKERQLLRGEYKYFTGKKADLRGALISDCLAVLQVNCFFEFWHSGLVEDILTMLTQCIHELTPEESLEVLCCLPKLVGDRFMVHPLWRHSVDYLLPILEDLSFDDTMKVLHSLKDVPSDKMPELVDGCLFLMAATWDPSMRLSLTELVLLLQTVASVPAGRRRHFLLPHSPFTVYLARATVEALPEMDDAVDVGDFLQAADILRLFEEHALELPEEIRPMNQPGRLSPESFHPDDDPKQPPTEFDVPIEEVQKNEEYRREHVLEQVRRGIFATTTAKKSRSGRRKPSSSAATTAVVGDGELEVLSQQQLEREELDREEFAGVREAEEKAEEDDISTPEVFLKEGSCKALSFALYSLCCHPDDKKQLSASVSAVVRAQESVLLRLPAFTVAELFAVAATYSTHAIFQQQLGAEASSSSSSASAGVSIPAAYGMGSTPTLGGGESSMEVMRVAHNGTLDGFLHVLHEVFERLNRFLSLSQSQLEPEILVSYLQIISQLYTGIPKDRLPFCTLNFTVKEMSSRLIQNHRRFELRDCVRFALLLPTLPSGLLDAAVESVVKQLAATARTEKDPTFAAKAYELLADNPYFSAPPPDSAEKGRGGGAESTPAATLFRTSRSHDHQPVVTGGGKTRAALPGAKTAGLSMAERLEAVRRAAAHQKSTTSATIISSGIISSVKKEKVLVKLSSPPTVELNNQQPQWRQKQTLGGSAGLNMKRLRPSYQRIIHTEVLPALRKNAAGGEF